jgi:hypothetical protein
MAHVWKKPWFCQSGAIGFRFSLREFELLAFRFLPDLNQLSSAFIDMEYGEEYEYDGDSEWQKVI